MREDERLAIITLYLQAGSSAPRSDSAAAQAVSELAAITDLDRWRFILDDLHIARSSVSINYLN